MTHWIESIPATFWGVLAGSFFTLVGVWLTNRAQSRRLAQQFDHERALKREERELVLKRDVYLPATEAVSAGMLLLGRLPDLSVPQDKLLDDWVARSPAIARANLVANDRTLEGLTRFHTSLSTKLFGLFGVRMRLTLKTTERQSLMDNINRLTSENGNLVTLMQDAGQHDPTNVARRATLKRQFDIGHEKVNTLLEQHDKLNQQLLDEQLRFMALCNGAVAELNELLIPLLASARAELGLPFDTVAYAKLIREAQRKMTVDLEGFIEELRSIVNDA